MNIRATMLVISTSTYNNWIDAFGGRPRKLQDHFVNSYASHGHGRKFVGESRWNQMLHNLYGGGHA